MESSKGNSKDVKSRVLEIINESIQVKSDVKAHSNQIVTIAKHAVATLEQGGNF